MPDDKTIVRRRWTLSAVAFVLLGLLVVIPSGLCSAILGYSVFSQGGASDASNVAGFLLMVAFVGGIPFIGGIVLILVGLRIRRRQ